MTDKALADILARTYAHRVTAFRPLAEGEERLCEAAPCALSRSEHTSAPTPPSLFAAWPEALYRLTLYTRPELAFRLGDRVEVTDEGGSVWMGRTSDSFRYDSHCVTVVEISHVGAPGGTQQSGSDGERTSSGMSELLPQGGNEGYEACEDEDDRFVEACQMLDYIEDLADILTFAELEVRVKTVDMLQKDGMIDRLEERLKRTAKEVDARDETEIG